MSEIGKSFRNWQQQDIERMKKLNNKQLYTILKMKMAIPDIQKSVAVPVVIVNI